MPSPNLDQLILTHDSLQTTDGNEEGGNKIIVNDLALSSTFARTQASREVESHGHLLRPRESTTTQYLTPDKLGLGSSYDPGTKSREPFKSNLRL